MTNPLDSAYLSVAPEIAQALARRIPVAALESTIISHGMPYPENVATALRVWLQPWQGSGRCLAHRKPLLCFKH